MIFLNVIEMLTLNSWICGGRVMRISRLEKLCWSGMGYFQMRSDHHNWLKTYSPCNDFNLTWRTLDSKAKFRRRRASPNTIRFRASRYGRYAHIYVARGWMNSRNAEGKVLWRSNVCLYMAFKSWTTEICGVDTAFVHVYLLKGVPFVWGLFTHRQILGVGIYFIIRTKLSNVPGPSVIRAEVSFATWTSNNNRVSFS